MLFSPISKNGQQKLLKSSVLVIGVGALGTSILDQLVRIGIGEITIVDRDYVELSNLQRQTLFTEEDVENVKPKAIAAKERLRNINSSIKINAYVDHVSNDNVKKYIQDIDLIFDGTDNFQTRYLLNDVAFKYNIPFAYGGVVSSRGMFALFIPNKTPCLRCFTKDNYQSGETCDTVGVIYPAVNVVTSLQVTEAIKYLTGNEDILTYQLTSFDMWDGTLTNIKFTKPDPQCKTCQLKTYPSLNEKESFEETVLCGRNTIQLQHHDHFNLQEWQKRFSKIAEVFMTPFLLKVKLEEDIAFVLFPNGRLLIQGTEDPTKARSLYDRYIGS